MVAIRLEIAAANSITQKVVEPVIYARPILKVAASGLGNQKSNNF